jgi:hypothetical protein
MRDRTADLLRARQALSQLSYNPSNWSYILATFTSAFGLLYFWLTRGNLCQSRRSFATCALAHERRFNAEWDKFGRPGQT